jgi:hypothetical protein
MSSETDNAGDRSPMTEGFPLDKLVSAFRQALEVSCHRVETVGRCASTWYRSGARCNSELMVTETGLSVNDENVVELTILPGWSNLDAEGSLAEDEFSPANGGGCLRPAMVCVRAAEDGRNMSEHLETGG